MAKTKQLSLIKEPVFAVRRSHSGLLYLYVKQGAHHWLPLVQLDDDNMAGVGLEKSSEFRDVKIINTSEFIAMKCALKVYQRSGSGGAG